jgi:hypothetical protein
MTIWRSVPLQLGIPVLLLACGLPARSQVEPLVIYRTHVTGVASGKEYPIGVGEVFSIPIDGGDAIPRTAQIRVFPGTKSDLASRGMSGEGPCSPEYNTIVYPLVGTRAGRLNTAVYVAATWFHGIREDLHYVVVAEDSSFFGNQLRILKRDVARYFDSGAEIKIAAPNTLPIIRPTPPSKGASSGGTGASSGGTGAAPVTVGRCVEVKRLLEALGGLQLVAEAVPCSSVAFSVPEGSGIAVSPVLER